MYGDSHALSSDSRPILPLPEQDITIFPKQLREQPFLFMESDSIPDYKQQNSSGLLRFRSAPSSLLQNFVEKNESFNSRLGNHDEKSSNGVGRFFSGVNSQLPPQYPRPSCGRLRMDGHGAGGYGVFPGSNMDVDQHGPGKTGSGLMRQNTSPAGLFSHLASQNGYASRRDVGNYRIANDDGSNGDLSPSSNSLRNHMNYPGVPSSLGILSRINEVENKNSGTMNSLDEARDGNSGDGSLFYSSGFPFGSWNDPSTTFPETFIKSEIDNDQSLYFNTQNGEAGNRLHILPRQSSLPKTSSEISAMEKMLHLQDSVPCKIRAKRGCATHPRSIAERLRRNRISERMRKLQELVPNMEKQTNTADMLDLAVEYIKTLQKQYRTLSENRANCKCSAFQNTIRS